MKLNDFVNKKHKVKLQASPIVIKNEALEDKYKSRISDLSNEIDKLKVLEEERDAAYRKLNVERDKLQTSQKKKSKLEVELIALRSTVSDQELFMKEIPRLKKEIGDLNVQKEKDKSIQTENTNLHAEITSLKNTLEENQTRLDELSRIDQERLSATNFLVKTKKELEDMSNNAFSKGHEISNLNKDIRNLKAENQSLLQELTENKSAKISAEEDAKVILRKNIELQTFANKNSTINQELKKEVKAIKDQLIFWKREAEDVSKQLEDADSVEIKLREWITNLENEDSKTQNIKGKLSKDVTTMKNTISEMGGVIEGLIKENNYLRMVNRDFRKELSRPRYLSMGAISKREGFKMPQGKENIRTRNLGNAVPTLLKFKEGGE